MRCSFTFFVSEKDISLPYLRVMKLEEYGSFVVYLGDVKMHFSSEQEIHDFIENLLINLDEAKKI